MLEWLFNRSATAESVERREPIILASSGTDSGLVKSGDPRVLELFGYAPVASGAVVNETTAMRVSVVYACVSLLAGAVAQLPLHIYERAGDERSRIDHDLWWLLNEQAGPQWTSATFWEYVVAQMLLRGDGIAYIHRSRSGEPVDLTPYPRSSVVVKRVPSGNPRLPGRLHYSFRNEEGTFGADQDDVLHFPNFGFNGICSPSTIQWGARSGIGIAIRSDEFAGKFFSQGAFPRYVLRYKNRVEDEQRDEIRQAWAELYETGEAGISIKPTVLSEEGDVKELSIPKDDAQLIESRKWQVIDIARAFRITPVLIGETEKVSGWGSGVEQMGRGFVTYTLAQHLRRIKVELNRKLFRSHRIFAEHVTDALMQGDAKTQAEFFAKALGGPGTQGYMTVNEVRKMKNLPPLDGYDEIFRAGAGAGVIEEPKNEPIEEPAATVE